MSYTDNIERKTKFCVHCGAKIDARAEICPKCGVRVAPPPPPPRQEYVERKNPVLAAVLSFIFTGLGQIYNGEIGKGIALMIVAGICAVSVLFLIGLLLYPLVWILGIVDAYDTAKKINKGQKTA